LDEYSRLLKRILRVVFSTDSCMDRVARMHRERDRGMIRRLSWTSLRGPRKAASEQGLNSGRRDWAARGEERQLRPSKFSPLSISLAITSSFVMTRNKSSSAAACFWHKVHWTSLAHPRILWVMAMQQNRFPVRMRPDMAEPRSFPVKVRL